ncbi:spermine oxidase-like [Rhodnius prolixus]|uniref:Amine oxidase n=1 Tax=Rhodnius prolixus TaxID=13249 RepID=R4G478_RHOPR
MEQKNKEPKIVIIGGGVAGVAAATSLLDRGFEDVTIIEAEDRLGGRIYTVPFGTKHVDIGAHWIHGEVDNAVYGLVHRMDLVSSSGDFNNVHFIADDGRSVPADVGMLLFARSGNLLEDEEELNNATGSLEDYLISRCRNMGKQMIPENDLLEAFLKWMTSFECTIEGSDKLSDVSAAGLTHYKQCDGDPILSWKSGGYYNIIDILLGTHENCDGPAISLENHVSLNTEVMEIDWNGLVVLIKCTNGKLFRADHVIVTVSLGVLKEKYRHLFNPPLPVEKVRAIVGLGIGTVDKVYLRFPHRWWPEDCSGFSLLRTRDPPVNANVGYTWEHKIIGFYAENNADPTVIGAWLVGEAAKDMEVHSDQEVMDACYRELKAFLDNIYDIPYPEEIIRSKWYSNKHFRGSYSFRSINSEVLQSSADTLAKPLVNDFNKNMLFFAGEATHNHYYSTVHGALESGWREAKRIADMYPTVPQDWKKKMLSQNLPKSSL